MTLGKSLKATFRMTDDHFQSKISKIALLVQVYLDKQVSSNERASLKRISEALSILFRIPPEVFVLLLKTQRLLFFDLSINYGNGYHIQNIANRTFNIQDVNWLVQTHLDWSNGIAHSDFEHQFIGNA